MFTQGSFEGLSQGEVKAQLLDAGVEESRISPIAPVPISRAKKEQQREVLGQLAIELGAKSADFVIVATRGHSVKNGISGEHVKVFRNYNDKFKDALKRRFLYPEMIFDKDTSTLVISENSFVLYDFVKIASDYFTHIIFQDETCGDASLIHGDAEKSKKDLGKEVRSGLLHDPVSFTLEDVIDAIASIHPEEIIAELRLFSNNQVKADYLSPADLPFGRRHYVTRYTFLVFRAVVENGGTRYYGYEPRTGFVSILPCNGETDDPVLSDILDTMDEYAIPVIEDSIGMSMPSNAKDDHYLKFAEDIAYRAVGDIEAIASQDKIYASSLFSGEHALSLYIDRSCSSEQPIKKADVEFRGPLSKPRRDRIALIFDGQWLHDEHMRDIAHFVLDSVAHGMGERHRHLYKLSAQSSLDMLDLCYLTLLYANVATLDEVKQRLQEVFLSSENVAQMCQSIGVSASGAVVGLFGQFFDYCLKYAESVKTDGAYTRENVTELANTMIQDGWDIPFSKIEIVSAGEGLLLQQQE